jgi:hypothetical protein
MDANAKIITGLRTGIEKRNQDIQVEEHIIRKLLKGEQTDYYLNQIRQKQEAIRKMREQNETSLQKINQLESGAQQERERQAQQERERLERENPNNLLLITNNTEFINRPEQNAISRAAFNYLKEVNRDWDHMTVSLFHILNVQEEFINNFAEGLIFRDLHEFSRHDICQPYINRNMSEYFVDLQLDPLNYKRGVTFKQLLDRTIELQTRTIPIAELTTIDKFRQFSRILEEAINLSYYINHFITKFIIRYMGSQFIIDSETMSPANKKALLNLINNAPISFIFHGRSDLYYTELGSHPFILPIADNYGAWAELGNGLYTTADINAARGYGDNALANGNCVNGKNILKITYGNGTADLYKETFGVLLKELSAYERLLGDNTRGTQLFNYHIRKPNISFCANIRSIIATEIVFLEKVKLNVYISGFINIDAETNICIRGCPQLLTDPTKNKTTTYYNYENEEKKMLLTSCERHLYQDVTTKEEKSQFYYKKYLKYKQKYNIFKANYQNNT